MTPRAGLAAATLRSLRGAGSRSRCCCSLRWLALIAAQQVAALITRPRRHGAGPGDHRRGRQRVPPARHADAGAARCRRARAGRRRRRCCSAERIYVALPWSTLRARRQRPRPSSASNWTRRSSTCRAAALAGDATAVRSAHAHADRRPAHPRRRDQQRRLAHRRHRRSMCRAASGTTVARRGCAAVISMRR